MKYFFILLIWSLAPAVYSCSCAEEEPSMSQYIENGDHIFVARLIDAKYIEPVEDPKYATFSQVEGNLSSDRTVFKGNPKHIVGLKTGMRGTSCEGQILVGEEYLVCGASEKYVSVPQCSLTTPIRWGNGSDVYELFSQAKK